MSARAYCDQPHPGDDAEADRWCEMHHRPATPAIHQRKRTHDNGRLLTTTCTCGLAFTVKSGRPDSEHLLSAVFKSHVTDEHDRSAR